MQSGRDVLEQALCLLHYTEMSGTGQADAEKRGLAAVNQIYADLWYMGKEQPFMPLISLDQPLLLPLRQLQDVMPYGVAMLLALSEGDGDNQQLYATIYNRKRTAASACVKRRDVLFSRRYKGARG